MPLQTVPNFRPTILIPGRVVLIPSGYILIPGDGNDDGYDAGEESGSGRSEDGADPQEFDVLVCLTICWSTLGYV